MATRAAASVLTLGFVFLAPSAGWSAGGIDTDGDGILNAVDNCPTVPNAFQDDGDLDRVGDNCDNCAFDFNSTQDDFNRDGRGDVCDPYDGLIYLVSTDETYVEWQEEQATSAYNVYEGDLDVLRSSGAYTQAPGSNPMADRHCGVSYPYVEDPEIPAVGRVKFALVTGVSAMGVESPLGMDSYGFWRSNVNPCP